MSLQYLKKEHRDEVDFLHGDKHQSFNKLVLSFLMEVAKLVQSMKNKNSVIFLKCTKKKKVANTFVFYCDANHSDILWGLVMLVVTCFS